MPQLELTFRPPPATPVPAETHELWEIVEAFLASDVESPNTRRAYRRHLEQAFSDLRVRSPRELTPAHLAAFRALVLASPLATASQAQALCALRAFLGWLDEAAGALPFPIAVARRVLRLIPVETVSQPAILDEHEIERVLAAATVDKGDRALLTVFLGAGLRVAEMAALDCADVRADVDGLPVLRVRGKRRKERLVPVHVAVRDAIEAYLRATARTLDSNGPLFLNHDSAAQKRVERRLTDRSIRRRVEHLLGACGVGKPVRVHGLRHTFAMFAIRRGCALPALQKLLGHASVATTQKYLDHFELDELRRAVPQTLVGIRRA